MTNSPAAVAGPFGRVGDPPEGSTSTTPSTHDGRMPMPSQHAHTATSPGGSKRWLNLLGGTLATVAAAAALSYCTSQTTVTSCKVNDNGASTATIEYQIKNRRPSSADYTVHFVVKDASGAQVGTGTDEVTALAAGGTANKTADVDLDAAGGKTCEVVDVT